MDSKYILELEPVDLAKGLNVHCMKYKEEPGIKQSLGQLKGGRCHLMRRERLQVNCFEGETKKPGVFFFDTLSLRY